MKQTKTVRFITIVKSLALAGLVFLAGCSNILAPQVKGWDAKNAEPGTGSVRIDIEGSGSGARTLLPQTTQAGAGGFGRYDLLFEDQAGSLPNVAVPGYTSNDEIPLPAATWTLTVSAFLLAGDTVAAATGAATVPVTPGVVGVAVPVTLKPVESAATTTGTGTFAWDISFPADTVTVTLAITNLSGGAVETHTLKGAGTITGTLAGTNDGNTGSTVLNAGSYYVTTTLIRGAEKALRRDALYILNGMTTTADAAAGYAFTDSDYSHIRYVTSTANTGAGTLRQAITDAADGDTIQVTLPKGSVITLTTVLPNITKSLTIEGNGVTLTQSGFPLSSNTSLFYIYGDSSDITAVDLTIRRVHFKDGLSGGYGGYGAAIYSQYATLSLESSIFSGNQSTNGSFALGGALYAPQSNLTILGCTFYNNSGQQGGVLYSAATVTLAGNLFYGNTAKSYGNILQAVTTVTSLGYNVSDKVSGTDDTAGSGFTFVTGDTTVNTLPVSRVSFKPTAGSAVLNKVNASAIPNYPTTDFYGDPIPASSATVGAVQTPIAAGAGYALGIQKQGPGTAAPSGATPDGDGLYTPGTQITLTATPASGTDYFAFWTVNGVKQTGNPLQVTPSEDTEVKAVFGRIVTVTSGTNGTNNNDGTLRGAIYNAQDYDKIVLDGALTGQTITLSSALPNITTSLTIEGNGVTLTRNFAGNNNTQLLYINSGSADVTVRRVHFKDGRASSNGGAVVAVGGLLTLESCIFSGNQTSSNNAAGGTIYTYQAALTVLGCTFYNNSTPYRGGAIYVSNSVITLAGNLFYGNTAGNSGNVVYLESGTVTSLGYNVSDLPISVTAANDTASSGFASATGDTQVASTSISRVSLKLAAGSGVLGTLNVSAFTTANPAIPYPVKDFYGDTISTTSAAAGAVQATSTGTGFYLNITSQGNGSAAPSGSTPDGDGLYSSATPITLTATPTGGTDHLAFWIVNDVKQEGNPIQVTLTEDTEVKAVFGRTVAVTSNAFYGVGSLYAALSDQQDYDRIVLDNALTGQTITLSFTLSITKSLTIEGNGVTLTPGFAPSSDSRLLYISNAAAEVTIRRVHFKNGRITGQPAGILNYGSLTLESCIFSGNQASGTGGAIYSYYGALTVLGCTFYNNSSTASNGGAIYSSNAVTTLAGNLFYGNTAASGSNVVYPSGGTVTSLGYNVSDKADGTNSTTGSGFTFVTGDEQITTSPISRITFKPAPGSAVLNKVAASTIPNYPTVDFFGDTIPGSSATAGAAQVAVTPTGYLLDITTQGTGTTVTPSTAPNGDGLYGIGASVTLTANPTAATDLAFWTVNGVKRTGNPLAVTLNEDTEVKAVFGRKVPVTDEATLRAALTALQDYDIITLPAGGSVITLAATLPQITKSLILEGNGLTLTRSFAEGSTVTPLLYINNSSAELAIRRVHFKDGRSVNNGAAIYNSSGAALTLESCIFSGNQVSAGYGYGGAISTGGTLTVLGCTFYDNSALWMGGAIYNSSNRTITLAGNLFYGNTAPNNNVMNTGSGTVTSLGYNVSDKADGTNSTTGSGFAFVTGDTQVTASSISRISFKPNAGSDVLNKVTPSAIPGYPTKDFYGVTIPTASAAAGAVQTPLAPGTGYVLSIATQGNGTFAPSGATPDGDGLYTPGTQVTLTATPDSGTDYFTFWIVNGVKQAVNPIQVILSEDTEVKAVFGRNVTVTSSADSGNNTLRAALTALQEYDRITMDSALTGQTITLGSILPKITKSVTLNGNGVTLTRSFTGANDTQLLNITAAEAAIRRIHFKDGWSNGYGSAIYSEGSLTLESCIF
jgi:hypothetical protein